MSYMLPHLRSGWAVDQAILNEENRVVVIRFGHDENESCMVMDEILFKISEDVKNFAVIYLVDLTEVPDFNVMYELYDDMTLMFFFRNKHIMIDLGTGNNNKINFKINDKQEVSPESTGMRRLDQDCASHVAEYVLGLLDFPLTVHKMGRMRAPHGPHAP
jgi:U5 snRNP protein, DIM1 family